MSSLGFYPFLFICYAVLAPLASNLGEIPPTLALRPLLVLLGAAGLLMLLFYVIFREGKYAAYLVFLLAVFFFGFAHLLRLAQDKLSVLDDPRSVLLFLGAWALLLLVLALKPVWIRLGGRSWMAPFFNLVFLVALVVPVFQVARAAGTARLAAASIPAAQVSQPDEPPVRLDCSSTPDIYYILLDAYTRQDVLQELYGVDNAPFLEYLRGKGFYVADESHTNYIQTIFSVPAGLNFDYIDVPSGDVVDGEYFVARINDSRLMGLLRACGYRIAVLKSGFYFTDQIPADMRLTGSGLLNELEGLLLADTPYSLLAESLNLSPPESSYPAHRQRVLDGFSQLRNAPHIPGPKLVFAHIITPHPPFVFGANGEPLEPPRAYSLADGDENGATLAEYRQGYAGQVQFANQKLEGAIDAILANSHTPPVIIIQGDHGAGSGLNWGSPAASCLWERSAILNAYYLPQGAGVEALYPSISPVNSFRVVLNSVFGTALPLLPDRTYFTSHRLIRQAIDITAQRDARANCVK